MSKTIDVLIFTVDHLFFGTYAKQIHEVLNAEIKSSTRSTASETIPYRQQELRVIDFSERINSKTRKGNRPGEERRCENRELPDDDVARQPERIAPFSKILVIEHEDNKYVGVRVDNIAKLETIPISQIRALPALMRQKNRFPGLWGFALLDKGPVILVDLAPLSSSQQGGYRGNGLSRSA